MPAHAPHQTARVCKRSGTHAWVVLAAALPPSSVACKRSYSDCHGLQEPNEPPDAELKNQPVSICNHREKHGCRGPLRANRLCVAGACRSMRCWCMSVREPCGLLASEFGDWLPGKRVAGCYRVTGCDPVTGWDPGVCKKDGNYAVRDSCRGKSNCL
eukprot:352149-Chlamydomonas_euryale.AAC.3